MSNLFIPGRGVMDSRVYLIDRALNDYDDRLMFARNEDTGDWCVYVRMPSPEPPFPVFGCGRDIPNANELLARIKEGDMMRNGDRIYNDMIKSQEKYRADLKYKGDQATEESSEVVEHFMRQHGESPIIKVFPKGVSAGDD